jgi:hypothetical protein
LRTWILSLGLGIGANTAVFSVINVVMLRDMPVREPGQLVEPRTHYPGDPPMNFFAWPSHFAGAATLSDLAGVGPQRLHVTVDGGATETVDADYVTGSLFPMLGAARAWPADRARRRPSGRGSGGLRARVGGVAEPVRSRSRRWRQAVLELTSPLLSSRSPSGRWPCRRAVDSL